MKWNFIVKYDIIETDDKERNKRNFKKGNYLELKRHFKGINWQKTLGNGNIDNKHKFL